MIRARDLSKAYARGRPPALSSVSFEVAQGACLGLLGPNGAGKSTLLSILSASLAPTSGDAFVAGASIVEAPEGVRRNIGLAPQGGALYPELTAEENVELFAALAGAPHPRAAALAALTRVGLATQASARAGALSGGQRQRVNLAAALAHDPPVLLLDEPTTGLDPGARERVWDAIRDARRPDRALVVSTHSIDEAKALCDRVLFLSRGRVVADVPAREADALADRYHEEAA